MSKRKGMSLEEKRATILNIYHTGPGLVYNLKEIESLASKLGVVSQSIKDVNQGLVDDGLVEVEKIGASNIFFAFPGKALAQKRAIAANLEREIAKLRADVSLLEGKALTLGASRENTAERTVNMAEYQAALAVKAEQEAELQKYKDNDPEKIERLQAQIILCKQAVNRWTDNTFAVKSYLVKKRNMYSKDVDRFLGLTDAFDYLD